jgi:hypothetical protein
MVPSWSRLKAEASYAITSTNSSRTPAGCTHFLRAGGGAMQVGGAGAMPHSALTHSISLVKAAGLPSILTRR